MLVLKCSQDKLLSVLQSTTEIVERRHVLPFLQNVLVRGSTSAQASFVSLLRSLTNAPLGHQKFRVKQADQTEPLNQQMGFSAPKS